MNERVLKCLYDIKSAIEEIDTFLESNPTDFENYKNDTLLKRAIERNLEIIGEAMSRVLREDPDFQIENARRIIGLRNQIIHGYDAVSDESIWGIIVNHIPNLKKEINKLIN
jgi:uncharacterized protein with HEPN domain